jgi:hypothetical protein
MKLVVEFNEVHEAVKKYLHEQGVDFDPNTLKVEYEHDGKWDEREVVGFRFVCQLKKKEVVEKKK